MIRYENMEQAVFLSRPNRFVAQVRTARGEETAHVKNTGRCRELLVPGAVVYVQRFTGRPDRKTELDLISVEKACANGEKILINMDSQVPNKLVLEWLLPNHQVVKPEVRYGNSRFDLYVEQAGESGFVEVKGVTLESDGHASFPDAPTARGVKHVYELIEAARAGYTAYIFFVVQMAPMLDLRPNDGTDPEFGRALRAAKAAGVKLLARQCTVTPDSIAMGDEIPVLL